MIPLRTILFAMVLTGPASSDESPTPPRSGPWRAWLECPGGELPFEFVLARTGAEWTGRIVNGADESRIPQVIWDGAELVLDITHYESGIRATPKDDGKKLDGLWRKRAGLDKWVQLPFHAAHGAQPRFSPVAPVPADQASSVTGRWSVKFASDEDRAVGIFKVQSDGTATGTFLTTTGDYGFLAGSFDGQRLRLSAFDGAHAFLFDAALQEDGTLKGDFWSRDAFHDTWTARKDPAAELPDAFTLTKKADGYDLSKVSFPDLQGTPRSLSDPAFAGKARIIEVFGSWCPNCNDASHYLADLHRRFRDRGLSVVGLAFELTGDPKRDARQVKAFAAVHKVEYPLLIAGVSDRAKASAALPMLEKLNAYPTLIVFDGKDRVRAIYTGFSGPATGEAYEAFKTRFESLIESLLARPDDPVAAP